MKIAIVCPYAWDRHGGVQSHVRSLATQLLERGHEVTIVAPGRSRDTGGDLPVRIVGRTVPVPANGSVAPISFGPLAARRLKRVLDELDPDVVHVHEPLIPSLSLLTVWTGGAPIVGTFHASTPSSAGYRLARPVLARAAERLALRTAVSDAARELAGRYFPGDYRLTPNGVDATRFSTAPPMDFGGRPAILFLGRLERRKGVEVLVQAVSTVSDLNPLLIVAGMGPRENSARTLARRLGVDAHFLGSLDDHNVAAVYRGADVYCAPNLGGESFGIVLLEAMAAGTPVVGSNLDAFRAVAADAALFVRPGNPAELGAALRRVLTDPGTSEELGRRGLRRAKMFDWGRLVPNVETAYADALEADRINRVYSSGL